MKNKALESVSKKYSILYNTSKNIVYGKYNGYYICVFYEQNISGYSIIFPINKWEAGNEYIVEKLLNKLKVDNKRLLYVGCDDHSIRIDIPYKIVKKRPNNILERLINQLLGFAKQNNLNTCCQLCGQESEMEAFLINGSPCYCCKSCEKEIQDDIAEAKYNERKRKGKFIRGTLGGIVGASLGVSIWVISSMLGYMAAIAGLVIAICTIKGYKFFGGKINKVGIIITYIITIVMIYAAQYLSLSLEIYRGQYQESIIDAIRFVPSFLLKSDVNRVFYTDLAIGYTIALIGSILIFKHTYNQRNFKIRIENI